jgi:hypothetical protein
VTAEEGGEVTLPADHVQFRIEEGEKREIEDEVRFRAN